MQKMRVAFFTDTFLPNVDGVVRSMQSYRRELESRGTAVFVFASGSAQARKANRDKRVFYFPSVSFPPYPQYKLAYNPFRAKKIVEKNRVALIHCHAFASMGVSAVNTARDLGLPLVGTFHTMLPRATMHVSRRKFVQKIAERIAWRAIRVFYAPFDVVTVPSRAIKKALEKHGVKNVAVVTNGVAEKFFGKPDPKAIARVKKRLGLSGRKIVLVAGRVSFEKNVPVIIRSALHMKRKPLFLVTGEGPAKKSCTELVRRLGLEKQFVFTGFVSDDELKALYDSSDCFATASAFETQGLCLLEAMACGLPCVGANALAIPEAIEDGKNGFLFRPFDARDCAKKLDAVLSLSEEERRAMAKKARKTASLHTVRKATDALLKAYAKAIQANKEKSYETRAGGFTLRNRLGRRLSLRKRLKKIRRYAKKIRAYPSRLKGFFTEI